MGPSVAVLTFYKGQLEELMKDGSARGSLVEKN
jgi:hypothetical protein